MIPPTDKYPTSPLPKKKRKSLSLTIEGETPEEQFASAQSLLRTALGLQAGGIVAQTPQTQAVPKRFDPSADRARQAEALRAGLRADPRLLSEEIAARGDAAAAQEELAAIQTIPERTWTPIDQGTAPKRKTEAIPKRGEAEVNPIVMGLAGLAGLLHPRGAARYAGAPIESALQLAERDYQDNLRTYSLMQTQNDAAYEDAIGQRREAFQTAVTNRAGETSAQDYNARLAETKGKARGSVARGSALLDPATGLPSALLSQKEAATKQLEASLIGTSIEDKAALNAAEIEDAQKALTEKRISEDRDLDRKVKEEQLAALKDYRKGSLDIAGARQKAQETHWGAMESIAKERLDAYRVRTGWQFELGKMRLTAPANAAKNPELAQFWQARLKKEAQLEDAYATASREYEAMFNSFRADPDTYNAQAKAQFIESHPVVTVAKEQLEATMQLYSDAERRINTEQWTPMSAIGTDRSGLPTIQLPGFGPQTFTPGLRARPMPKTDAGAAKANNLPAPTASKQHTRSNLPPRSATAPSQFSVRPGKPGKTKRSLSSGLLSP